MSATGQRIAFDRETAQFPIPEERTAARGAEVFSAAQIQRSTIAGGRFHGVAACCEAAADFLTVMLGVLAADFLHIPFYAGGLIDASMRETTTVGALAAVLVVLLLKGDNAYQGIGSLLRIRQTERATKIPMQALLALLPLIFLLHLHFPLRAIFGSLILVPLFLILQKQVFASIARTLHLKNRGVRRVVVYGSGESSRRIISSLLDSPRLGLLPVAVIDDDAEHVGDRIFELGYRRRCSIPVRHGPVTPMLLKSCNCEVLLLAIPDLASEKLSAITRAAKQAGMQVASLANSGAHEWQRTESIDIDGLVVTSTADPITPWHYAIAKRITDVVFSLLLLVLLAPLLIVIALLIRLDSLGPALFIQKRVGLNGKLFDIYKFRSMYLDSPKYDLSPATADDGRITRVGRFLRRTSLDELPQLVNVLRGDMSLVGPRPEMPFVVGLYNARDLQRLQVTPGITGLWQLSADRIYQIHENLEYDFYYIRNRSFFLDMAILIHTLFFAMRGI